MPDENWNAGGKYEWKKPPQKNTVKGNFKVDAPDRNYILSIAILDPAGNIPSLRFATANYLNGGRHPVGMLDLGRKQCHPLPTGFTFNDPAQDNSLHYIK